MLVTLATAALLTLSSDPCDPALNQAIAAQFPHVRARDLLRVARRESACVAVGEHPGDAWAWKLMHRKAVRRGILNPQKCATHAPSPAWSVRGSHGLAPPYVFQYLPEAQRCGMSPRALEIPAVSAKLAALRLNTLCETKGACTPSAWRAYSRGLGNVRRARERKLQREAEARLEQQAADATRTAFGAFAITASG